MSRRKMLAVAWPRNTTSHLAGFENEMSQDGSIMTRDLGIKCHPIDAVKPIEHETEGIKRSNPCVAILIALFVSRKQNQRSRIGRLEAASCRVHAVESISPGIQRMRLWKRAATRRSTVRRLRIVQGEANGMRNSPCISACGRFLNTYIARALEKGE